LTVSFILDPQSHRRGAIGSIFAARRAGSQQASIAIAMSNSVTPAGSDRLRAATIKAAEVWGAAL
jgi:hypothetical protein